MTAREVIAQTYLRYQANGFENAADQTLLALHAAGYVVEQGWRTIESAPKDGSPIMGYGPHPSFKSDELEARQTHWALYGEASIAHADYLAGKGPSGNWQWYEPIHNWVCGWHPTHWRPLSLAEHMIATPPKEPGQ